MKIKKVITCLLGISLCYLTAVAQFVPAQSTERKKRFGVFDWTAPTPPPGTPAPNNTPLTWGAYRSQQMGADVIRVVLGAGQDPYNLFPGVSTANWTLTKIVNPSLNGGNYAWDNLFKNPAYKTYLISTYTQYGDKWLTGFSANDALLEKNELKELGIYLNNKSDYAGKTFIFMHWEGDHAFEDYSYWTPYNGAGFYFHDGYPTTAPNPNDPGQKQYDRQSVSVPIYKPNTFDQSVNGQYVRIQLLPKNPQVPLSLAEVEVWGRNAQGVPVNYALNKLAAQSSTGYGGTANRAVDGNTNGAFWSGSVTHTNTESQPWWEVNLQQMVTIDKVVVWNRTDCCSERLDNFIVYVGQSPNPSSQQNVGSGFYGVTGIPSSLAINAGEYLYGDVTIDAANPPETIQLWWQDEQNNWFLAHYPVQSSWHGKRVWLQTLVSNLGPDTPGTTLVGKKVKHLEFDVFGGQATLHSAGPRRYQNRWQDMVSWMNARADGIREARGGDYNTASAYNIQLYTALEFYQTFSRSPGTFTYYRYAVGHPKAGQFIRTGEDDNVPSDPPDPAYPGKYRSALSYVAPRVNVDYYSYSSWETLATKNYPAASNVAPRDANPMYSYDSLRDQFKANLTYACNTIKNMNGISNVPPNEMAPARAMVNEKNFLIGEWFLGTQSLINEFFAAFEGANAFKPSYMSFFEHTYLFNGNSMTPSQLGMYYRDGVTNLAASKAATQSSLDWGGVPERAVDGNTSGIWSNNSITHTALQTQPWWQVDLGSVQSLQTVKLWGMTDCCMDRLSNFYVFVSDFPFTSNTVSGTLAQSGVTGYYFAGQMPASQIFNINRTGRYVRVQLTGTNYLSLAEVEVR